MRIGVDAGGTFTDFVVVDDRGRVSSFKLRSNPGSPAKVILEGIERASQRRRADVVHGSTVATNALLERKGAQTAFVTTAGFEDILEIGRQNRTELYNLTPTPRRLLVPRNLCFGVRERALFDGSIEQIPSAAGLERLLRVLRKARIESVAICFLHSYANASNEKRVLNTLSGLRAYVCASHEISPEFREYERGSTTAVNAYVGPLMDAYLGELERGSRHRIQVMQSNGGFLSARDARRHAVRTVLSGPAGGVVGALETARQSGFHRILGFDMGGTSTDVSLVDRVAHQTTEATVDGLPIRVPMLDIHTVGAGGGSLARIDSGGLLRVGPESAGADPGPACYGKGDKPTVTDAHVALGRIDSLLGGAMRIDAERARTAVDSIARALKLTTEEAAAGILRVANANMERAIRVVSVERGHDPRDFALLAFGGCGGLHACEIAEELGIGTVIVPQLAGALSALGMLLADGARDYAAGVLGQTDVERAFRKLERKARSPHIRSAQIKKSADIRYSGQSYEINVPWRGPKTSEAFHKAHEKLYGYSSPKAPFEIVTIRVRAVAKVKKPRLLRTPPTAEARSKRNVWISGAWRNIPVWQRTQIVKTQAGPALVLDYGSTTMVPAGWRFTVDGAGSLIVRSKTAR
jgi:N-methylhydantoinase A/oxoprolinase/acetone carboxylase beta subunit